MERRKDGKTDFAAAALINGTRFQRPYYLIKDVTWE
jgi:hypothetical protein